MKKNMKNRILGLRQLADDLENNTWYLGEFNEFEGKDFDYYFRRLYEVFNECKRRVDNEVQKGMDYPQWEQNLEAEIQGFYDK